MQRNNSYFKSTWVKEFIPKVDDYVDIFDSFLNIEDDKLKIQAINDLQSFKNTNFYRVDQDNEFVENDLVYFDRNTQKYELASCDINKSPCGFVIEVTDIGFVVAKTGIIKIEGLVENTDYFCSNTPGKLSSVKPLVNSDIVLRMINPNHGSIFPFGKSEFKIGDIKSTTRDDLTAEWIKTDGRVEYKHEYPLLHDAIGNFFGQSISKMTIVDGIDSPNSGKPMISLNNSTFITEGRGIYSATSDLSTIESRTIFIENFAPVKCYANEYFNERVYFILENGLVIGNAKNTDDFSDFKTDTYINEYSKNILVGSFTTSYPIKDFVSIETSGRNSNYILDMNGDVYYQSGSTPQQKIIVSAISRISACSNGINNFLILANNSGDVFRINISSDPLLVVQLGTIPDVMSVESLESICFDSTFFNILICDLNIHLFNENILQTFTISGDFMPKDITFKGKLTHSNSSSASPFEILVIGESSSGTLVTYSNSGSFSGLVYTGVETYSQFENLVLTEPKFIKNQKSIAEFIKIDNNNLNYIKNGSVSALNMITKPAVLNVDSLFILNTESIMLSNSGKVYIHEVESSFETSGSYNIISDGQFVFPSSLKFLDNSYIATPNIFCIDDTDFPETLKGLFLISDDGFDWFQKNVDKSQTTSFYNGFNSNVDNILHPLVNEVCCIRGIQNTLNEGLIFSSASGAIYSLDKGLNWLPISGFPTYTNFHNLYSTLKNGIFKIGTKIVIHISNNVSSLGVDASIMSFDTSAGILQPFVNSAFSFNIENVVSFDNVNYLLKGLNGKLYTTLDFETYNLFDFQNDFGISNYFFDFHNDFYIFIIENSNKVIVSNNLVDYYISEILDLPNSAIEMQEINNVIYIFNENKLKKYTKDFIDNQKIISDNIFTSTVSSDSLNSLKPNNFCILSDKILIIRPATTNEIFYIKTKISSTRFKLPSRPLSYIKAY